MLGSRLAMLGALLLIAACTESPADAMSFHRVAVLGDSIALQSADEIAKAFEPTPVRNESVIGRRIDQAGADARGLATDDYDAVVVVLGANDARGGATQVDLGEIDWLLGILRHVYCVLWLEVPTTTDDAAFDRGAVAINARVAEDPDVTLIRWPARLKHLDEWVRDDGLHLTPAGQRALGDRLYDAVLAC
jgi:hypothetical protein